MYRLYLKITLVASLNFKEHGLNNRKKLKEGVWFQEFELV
jgi:hypothetical protein